MKINEIKLIVTPHIFSNENGFNKHEIKIESIIDGTPLSVKIVLDLDDFKSNYDQIMDHLKQQLKYVLYGYN